MRSRGTGSELQRLAYEDPLNPLALAASLDDVPALALAIFRSKGVIEDALLEDRLITQMSGLPELREQISVLRATKAQLAETLVEIPADGASKASERSQTDRKTLVTHLKVQEEALAKHVPGIGRTRRAFDVTWQEVKYGLPEHGVLVDFVRYARCLGTNQWEPCYGAIVLASIGEPRWVSLGRAGPIEAKIASVHAVARGSAIPTLPAVKPAEGSAPELQTQESASQPSNPATTGAANHEPLADVLEALYQQLWAPVERLLPNGTPNVVISPDAGLNLVSFAALLTSEGKFLGEKYAIRYVSTARDLVGQKKTSHQGPLLILGSPDFSFSMAGAAGAETNLTTMNASKQWLLPLPQLPQLSAIAQEVALVGLLARQLQSPFTVHYQDEATEGKLSFTNRPRILHLATAGFFLPSSPPVQAKDGHSEPERVGPVDGPAFVSGAAQGSFMPDFARTAAAQAVSPLYRSGVMLAGAQPTLASWERGAIPQSDDDGILTAGEIGTLKLAGTELVALSASDSGADPIQSAEGILTLRRAIIQAGADNLLLALRPDADESSAQMIADFYKRFHAVKNAARAFIDVQREWLVRLRQEHGLATAVRVAGSLVISSQGKIE